MAQGRRLRRKKGAVGVKFHEGIKSGLNRSMRSRCAFSNSAAEMDFCRTSRAISAAGNRMGSFMRVDKRPRGRSQAAQLWTQRQTLRKATKVCGTIDIQQRLKD